MKSEKRALVEMAIPVPVVTIAEATAEGVAERVARGDVTGAAAGATTNAEMMADLGATGIEVAAGISAIAVEHQVVTIEGPLRTGGRAYIVPVGTGVSTSGPEAQNASTG
jgi:hypothetical protein